ncbi:MAG: YggS family pyridoxal phosphate-dependent enzyme [Dehalococcoidia bacterium]|nr:YggS family pyridoxal phosphate-dependent enzyme [Dehalococcoidia bacterium]
MTPPIPSTAAEPIAARLAEVRARIHAACERAGRAASEVTLVAVSKGHPLEACAAAVAAGTPDLGENRVQEFAPKAQAAAAAGVAARWHFIGHLQTNKVRDALPHISVFHALDSTRLIEAITREAARLGDTGAAAARPLPCYLEVNIGGEPQKQGIAPGQVGALLAAAADCPAVRVDGLMTVAPRAGDPEQVRPVFRALRELAEAHGLTGLSMGMTDDFEVAIEEGATLIRVGRAIFGDRSG